MSDPEIDEVCFEVPPQTGDRPTRNAAEVFIFMHRCFRASRNIRAHWFLEHLNKTVEVPRSDARPCLDDTKNDKYAKEMEVLGVIPEGGNADENVEGEKFLITMNTKVTYISRYYRHVFVLDISPSTLVADDCGGAVVYTKVLENLRMALYAVTKSFKIPGTNHVFTPQIYVTICVFTPFLCFDQDLVLTQGIFLTESMVDQLLDKVTLRFRKLVKELHKFTQPIFGSWATRRRQNRVKYDSTCEPDLTAEGDGELRPPTKITARTILAKMTKKMNSAEQDQRDAIDDDYPLEGTMKYRRKIWKCSRECGGCDGSCDYVCDGYVKPEWALIFMLRLGLVAVQMLPENTQSNIVIITDAVCGMPDAIALQQLLTQLRSYTISCSFIQINGGAFAEPSFGHVSSAELFHFLAMATFGTFLPNCTCCLDDQDPELRRLGPASIQNSNSPARRVLSLRQDREEEEGKAGRMASGGSVGRRPSEELPPGVSAGAQPGRMNPFHRALLCWCFQNALQENQHIRNMANKINPEFAKLYQEDSLRHTFLRLSYNTTLPELLYVRLREGYTLKSTNREEDGAIRVTLSLPFRPSVFIDYMIVGSCRLDRSQRENILVEIEILAPFHVMRDILTEDGDFVDMTRQKGIKVFRRTLDSLIEADRLLLHLHSFNASPQYYTIPFGVSSRYSLFRLIDRGRRFVVEMPRGDQHTMTFVEFWKVLCNLDEGVWQKWVHSHCERLLLRVDEVPIDIFRENLASEITCEEANNHLHELLRDETSFCLLHQLAYVKFIYGDDPEVPKYFYMIRICSAPPAVTIKMAFLGGISSSDRRLIADDFRRKLIQLRLRHTSKSSDASHPVDADALVVVRRPVERILVRYRNVPLNLRTMVRLGDEIDRGEDVRNLVLHNSLAKYLNCRRRIWNLPSIFEKDVILGSSRDHATFMLHTILYRRLREGFNIAWAENGIVGLCRQVVNETGFALEQYVYFPPQDLYLPFKMNRNRLPSTCRTTENAQDKEDYGIVFEPDAPPKSRRRIQEPATYQLVGEYWSEPMSDDDYERPSSSRDDDLVSALFTLDQLIKWCDHCHKNNGGAATVHTTSRGKEPPAQMLSGCVAVAVSPFSLGDLLETAEKRLLLMPLFEDDYPGAPQRDENRMQLLLDATLAELKEFTDCYIDVEDSELWDRVMDVPDKEKRVSKSRIYLHRLNTWTMIAILAPMSAEVLNLQGGLPLLFCLCDEPTLAYRLTTRHEKPKMDVEDLRSLDAPWMSWQDEKAFNPPTHFVWPTRCSELQKGLYKPTGFAKYATSVRNEACGRAMLTAMYQAINKGFPVAQSTVMFVIDNICDYMKREVPKVTDALEKFCGHIQNLPPELRVRLPESCYLGSDFETLFANAVAINFKPIPSTPGYYIYQRKGRDRKATTQSDRSPLPFTSIEAASVGGDRTPDESEHSSLMRAGSAPPIRRRILKKYADIPLFVFFNCTIEFPDRTMSSFPVQHLPYCVQELIDNCPEKPTEPFELKDVRVRVEMYVLSWPIEDEADPGRISTSEEREKSYAKRRMLAFRDSLPAAIQEVIKKLLKNVERLIEMEMVLIEARKQEVTLEQLRRISAFISKEYVEYADAGGADRRLDQRNKPLQLVINLPDTVKKLKSRLDGITVENCVLKKVGDEMFYCMPFDETEKRTRNESRRASMSKSRQVSGEAGLGAQVSPLRERKPSSSTALYCDGRPVERSEAFEDFWLILTVSEENLLFQLCRRQTDRHDRLFSLIWRKVKQTVRVLNQEMLLMQTLQTRKVDLLLLAPPESDRFVGTKGYASDDDFDVDPSSHLPIKQDARFHYAPGYFACEVQFEHWFTLHPRVRQSRMTNMSGMGSLSMNSGVEALKRELEPFKVANSNLTNVYILSAPDENVLYMILHVNRGSVSHTVKNAPKPWKREAYTKLEQQNALLLTIHGVREPRQEYILEFIDKMQKRLDNTTLHHLSTMLEKNAHSRLEAADVQFIQKDCRSPSTLIYFGIPNCLAGYLQAIYIYMHQQLITLDIHPARCKDESGTNAEHTSFRSLPPPNNYIPNDYQPRFSLFVRPIKEGNKTNGIACLEMRFVNERREIVELSNGRLDKNTHTTFMRPDDPVSEQIEHYKSLLSFRRVEEPGQREDTCAYLEVAAWQAGDVGFAVLKNKLEQCLRMALCDVLTEYGLLNDVVVGLEQNLPMSPPTASLVTPGQRSHRPSLIRQRSSSEAQTPNTSKILTPMSSQKHMLSTIDQKQQLHFTFDAKPNTSFGSELDKLSKDEILREELISDDFLRCAESYWSMIIDWAKVQTPSLLKAEVEFDAPDTHKRVLSQDTVLQEQTRRTIPLQERLMTILESVPMREQLQDRVLVARRRFDGKYEVVRTNPVAKSADLLYDFGYDYDPELATPPEFLIIAQVKEVAEETMRYGMGPVGDPPEVLKNVARDGAREMFAPYLPSSRDSVGGFDRSFSGDERSAFVPRRRLFYGIVRQEKLTCFLYNFKPDLGRQIVQQITRFVHWHNGKMRLVKEIGMHKMGYQHLGESDKNSDNPFFEQLWRQPDEVLADELPEVARERRQGRNVSFHSRTPSVIRMHYADTLDRVYRHARTAFLVRKYFGCVWKDQLYQFIMLRGDVWSRVEADYALHQTHKQCLETAASNSALKVPEENLLQLIDASRMIHFVLTPILLFPGWRKKVALIRANGELELVDSDEELFRSSMPHSASNRSVGMGERKASGLSLAHEETGSRNRSFTLSASAYSNHDLEALALPSDLPEPWNIKILYLLVAEYSEYLKKIHGLEAISITNPCTVTAQRRAHRLQYDKKCTYPPEVWLYKATPEGLILLHLHFQSPYFVLEMHTWEATAVLFKALDR